MTKAIDFISHMRLGLRDDPNSVLWALDRHRNLEELRGRDPTLLTTSQRGAVLAFLRYLATYGPGEAKAARVERSWREAAGATSQG